MKLLTWSALLCSPNGETVTVVRMSWLTVTASSVGEQSADGSDSWHQPLSFFLVLSVPKRGPVTSLSLVDVWGNHGLPKPNLFEVLGYGKQEKEFLKIPFLEQPSFPKCRVFMASITMGKDFDY